MLKNIDRPHLTKSVWCWLPFILLLSFGISLSFAFYHRIPPVVDARAYDNIARNIVAGHGFRESASGDILFDRAIQRAGPAYEYFLAGIYAVFGLRYEAVWIAQALLHTLTAWLVYLCALLIFGHRRDEGSEKKGTASANWSGNEIESGQLASQPDNRAGIIGFIAAALFGLHPDLIEISAMLMTETWYLFWTVLAMYLFIRVWQTNVGNERWIFSVSLALTLGVGILSRPPLLLFVPVICWFYLQRKRLVELGLGLCLIALVLTPWTGRNYRIYSQLIPTTLIGEYNLWVGNTLTADGGQLASGHNPFDAYVNENGYKTVKQASSDAFVSFVKVHPGRFAYLTGVRFVHFFSLIRPMGFWFYQTGAGQLVFVAASGLAIVALFVFGFTGLVILWRERRPLYYYLIILALTAPLVLLPTVVQSRYRFQIYPFLALFAGYALYQSYLCGRSWWRRSAFLYTAGFLIGVSLIDVFISGPDIVSHLQIF